MYELYFLKKVIYQGHLIYIYLLSLTSNQSSLNVQTLVTFFNPGPQKLQKKREKKKLKLYKLYLEAPG